MYKRIIIKISGEALSNGKVDTVFCTEYIDSLLSEIEELRNIGIEIALVIGGGNIWRGVNSGHAITRGASDQIGMLATVQNALYIQGCLLQRAVPTVVMTPFAIGGFTSIYQRVEADRLLKEKQIIIFAGGLGHPYFSTDTVTALRGIEIDADGIFYTKNGVEGIYNKDPKKHSDVKLYKNIGLKQVLDDDNIKAIDKTAIVLLLENNKCAKVFSLEHCSLVNAAKGHEIGTNVTIENWGSEFYV